MEQHSLQSLSSKALQALTEDFSALFSKENLTALQEKLPFTLLTKPVETVSEPKPLDSLFSHIHFGKNADKGESYVYDFQPVTANSIFPKPQKGIEGRWQDLQRAFISALDRIPQEFKKDHYRYLAHFDSGMQGY